MKILGLKHNVMILGEERERTKGSPLARMDQLQRIYLTFPGIRNIRSTCHFYGSKIGSLHYCRES